MTRRLAACTAARDFTLEPDDGLPWGEASASWTLLDDGTQAGHAILARRETRTLFLIFRGVFFEEREMLRAFIDPKLDALLTWSASDD